jgi:hypothetical protein
MNCFTKTVTLQRVDYKEVVFRGDRRVLPNFLNLALKARKCLRKGCALAH